MCALPGREQQGDPMRLTGNHMPAFVPFAARRPLAGHLLRRREGADFAATTLAERDELAELYVRLLRGVDRLCHTPPPYIAAWHQAPIRERRDEGRMMLQLTSPRRAAQKLKFLAGSEAAMGDWGGDVPPETQAIAFRAALAGVTL